MKKYLFASMIFSSALLVACNNDSTTDGNKDSGTAMGSDSGARTQDATTAEAGTMTKEVTADDRQFMMDAAAGGMMEVQAGQTAQQNASSQKVKDFGAWMVTDHTKANDELKSIASSKNVTLPDSLPADKKEHLMAMAKMKGKAFDSHYMDMMVNDHKATVAKFEKAASSASDADVKAFAAKTLPIIKAHNDSAAVLKKRM